MHTYEVAIVYHPSLEVDLTKAEERIKNILKDNKAEIKSVDNWGKQKLAYRIKGNDFGIYVFYTVDILPQNVSKIDGLLNITDEVIRHLITKPDLEAKAQALELQKEKDDRNAKYLEQKEQSKEVEKES